MKHITFGEKSLLLGDEAADTLLEYAAALAAHTTGDLVTLNAISSDGDDVEASFLLGPGTTMMSETASAKFPEPDNSQAVSTMREKLGLLTGTHNVHPDAGPVVDYPDPLAWI